MQQLTLDGNDDKNGSDSDESGIASLDPQKIANYNGRQRSRPHVIDKNRYEIESVDIIGYEVHHFPWSSFAQSSGTQSQGLENSNTKIILNNCFCPCLGTLDQFDQGRALFSCYQQLVKIDNKWKIIVPKNHSKRRLSKNWAFSKKIKAIF